MTKTEHGSLRDAFRQGRGDKTVLWQWPNPPLIGWILCRAVILLIPASSFRTSLGLLAAALLFTWAYLELTSGINYFRRALGAIILVLVVSSFF